MAEISFHQINQSQLDTLEYSNGQLIFCRDTGNLYVDNDEGDRVSASIDVIYLADNATRLALLTPQAKKIYIVIEDNSCWMYSNDEWVGLNPKLIKYLPNVTFTTASFNATTKKAVYSNASITANAPINLIWRDCVRDIIDACGITVTSVTDGAIEITATEIPAYPVMCDIQFIDNAVSAADAASIY